MSEITLEQARAAVEVLVQYGRQGHQEPDSVSRGKAIGHAIYGCNDTVTCIEIALEMLEQWNCHLMVAAMLALWRGRRNAGHRGNPANGSVTHEGRDLRIRLPKWWA
jgi:hypothetical protein